MGACISKPSILTTVVPAISVARIAHAKPELRMMYPVDAQPQKPEDRRAIEAVKEAFDL
jgi:hypothetical protein